MPRPRKRVEESKRPVEIPDVHEEAARRGLGPAPGSIPFESRATHAPWFERIDPFWLGFGANPGYAWYAASAVEWDLVWHPDGPKWKPKWVESFEPIDSARRWTAPGGLVERVAALLLSWRVLTSQQIGALGSIVQSKVSSTLLAMMDAGLVERARMVAGSSRMVSTPYLWRLRVESKEFDRWFKTLSETQRKRLTLEVQGGAGGHDRHDVLVAEIALRACEVMPELQAIFGERSTPAKLLLDDHPQVRTRGDALIVRNDGLQIVLEFTAQPHIKEVARKMAQWGVLLGERGGPNATGIIVIFASGQYTGDGLTQLKRNLDRALTADALGGSNPAPPEVVHAARRSVLVADWLDWFPSDWCISERFVDLEAYYAAGEGEFFATKVAVNEPPSGVPFRPTRTFDWQWARRVRANSPAIPKWIEGPISKVAGEEKVS